MKKWFGYTIHLIADTKYELPACFKITKASESKVVNGRLMVDGLAEENPGILEKCKYFTGDKEYDDGKLIKKLEEHDVLPVIDIRNCWQPPPGDQETP